MDDIRVGVLTRIDDKMRKLSPEATRGFLFYRSYHIFTFQRS